MKYEVFCFMMMCAIYTPSELTDVRNQDPYASSLWLHTVDMDVEAAFRVYYPNRTQSMHMGSSLRYSYEDTLL